MRFMNDYELLFRKAIKNLRNERVLTQEELAHSANINAKHYGRIERGESSPTMNFFFLICNALDIKPDAFFKFMFEQEENE